MEKNQTNALAYLSGGLGLVILLGGVFNLYPALYGLLGALILGVTSGAIKRSWSGNFRHHRTHSPTFRNIGHILICIWTIRCDFNMGNSRIPQKVSRRR